MGLEKIGLWDMFDIEISNVLRISKEEYIEKIELIGDFKQRVLIGGLLSEDKSKVLRAKRLFNELTLKQ